MFKGEPRFCLVNVTAEDENTLLRSVSDMLTTDLFALNVDL
jgi:hypothetical protein